jgi:hypothetical protein
MTAVTLVDIAALDLAACKLLGSRRIGQP